MLKKRIWDAPIGVWLLSIIFGLLYYAIRSFYIDQDELRDAISALRFFDRSDEWFFHGWHPLGMAPLALLYKLFSIPLGGMEPLDAMRMIAAVCFTLTLLLLYKWMSQWGLSRGNVVLLLFFMGANATLCAATMGGQFMVNGLLVVIFWGAVGKLFRQKEPNASSLGLIAGLMTGLHMLMIVPAIVIGRLLAGRQAAGMGSYWASLLGLTLLIYGGSFALFAGGPQGKPGFVDWILATEANESPTMSPLSIAAPITMLERSINAILPLGPDMLRSQDIFQYHASGNLNKLLKGMFLIVVWVPLVMLFAIRGREQQRLSRGWPPTFKALGISFLLLLPLVIVWQGATLGLFYWLILHLTLLAGIWLAQFTEENQAQFGMGLAPLSIVLILFSLQKGATLTDKKWDPERDLVIAMKGDSRPNDIIVSNLKPAFWSLYYNPTAELYMPHREEDPLAMIERLMEKARAEKRRIIVWDHSLNGSVLRAAGYPTIAAWQEKAEEAITKWQENMPMLWRNSDMFYLTPTRNHWPIQVTKHDFSDE
ncbi:MAG: hypothetical protein HUU60_10645 [Armatimonadetes bacterium]|nr:hypothetical protein [Armatimonadota bacterium]